MKHTLRAPVTLTTDYRGRGLPTLHLSLPAGAPVNYNQTRRAACGVFVQVDHEVSAVVRGERYSKWRRTWALGAPFAAQTYYSAYGFQRVGRGLWRGYPGFYVTDDFGDLIGVEPDSEALSSYASCRAADDGFGDRHYTFTRPH